MSGLMLPLLLVGGLIAFMKRCEWFGVCGNLLGGGDSTPAAVETPATPATPDTPADTKTPDSTATPTATTPDTTATSKTHKGKKTPAIKNEYGYTAPTATPATGHKKKTVVIKKKKAKSKFVRIAI